jgi:hypothetical protein
MHRDLRSCAPAAAVAVEDALPMLLLLLVMLLVLLLPSTRGLQHSA